MMTWQNWPRYSPPGKGWICLSNSDQEFSCFIRFDVVVNTAGLLAEDLCLSLARGDGRVVSALIQPPGLKE